MKKLVLVLLVAVLSVPAFAANPTITLVAGPANSGEVDVMYNSDGTKENLPSGMGLTVTLSGDATARIIQVKNYKTDGESKATSKGYGIFPGQLVVNGTTLEPNTPVVGGNNVAGVTTTNATSLKLEFGALYKRGTGVPSTDPNAPAEDGKLCTIKVSKTCTVTITGDDASCGTGMGIIAQNFVAYPVSSVPVEQLVTIQTDCLYAGRVFTTTGDPLTVTATMVTRWTTLGKPSCWCCDAQKLGNWNTDTRVDIKDLGALKLSYGKTSTQSGYDACADFNLDGRIDIKDLGILKLKYGKVVGGCL